MNQSNVSDGKMERMIKAWFLTFIAAVVLCFLCDAFILHSIPGPANEQTDSTQFSQEGAEKLVHAVYPGAEIQQEIDTSVYGINQYVVKNEDELHLLWFDRFYVFNRWQLEDDLIIPENATGTFTYGPRFNQGTVELVDGKVIGNRTTMLTWKQESSFYILIATVVASVALIPVWLVEKKKNSVT